MREFQKIQEKVQKAVDKKTKEIEALEAAINSDMEALEVAKSDKQTGTATDDLSLYQDACNRVSFYEATVARKTGELEALKTRPYSGADELTAAAEAFRAKVIAATAEKKAKAADLLREIKALNDEINANENEAEKVFEIVQDDVMMVDPGAYRMAFPMRTNLFNTIRNSLSLEDAAGILDGTIRPTIFSRPMW